ncbi:MAG: penicillin acylase family protein [Planctomycetaceae bacterium]|nr:penicillin acylase family protein [Planctomycetaceae bacterium]
MLLRSGVVASVFLFLVPAVVLAADREVTIHRDTWGVPHIYADTAAAGAWGLGYAQAEDRLDDIHKAVRTGTGTMAEVFGKGFVEQDYLMRLCRNTEVAQRAWQALPEHLQQFMESFTRGIKAYSETHPDEVPAWAVELEPWMLLTVGRAMTLRWPLGAINDDLNNSDARPRPPMQSNEWAISPSRSADGIPILLSDPHLTWEGLAVMYEARVHAGDLHMNGYFLIGSPILAIGHNRHVGWALTTGGPDCGDVYEMTMRAGTTPEYLYDGEWRAAQQVEFTINVKDGDPVVRPAVYTHLGPVMKVSDKQPGKAFVGAAPLLNSTEMLQQAWKMVTSRNVREFYEALGMCEFNEQNFMFADVHGDIGYARVGKTPIRPKGYDWTAPVPGDTSATAWKGIHPIDDLIHVFNPPQGFMQNCNVSPENMMPDSPFSADRYLADIFNVADWEVNNPRGIRTRQLLENDDSVTRDEAIGIVMDVYDIHAERWQQELTTAVEAVGSDHMKSTEFAAVVHAILNWDGQFTPDATATSVYKFWRLKCGDKIDLLPIANGQHLAPADQRQALELLQLTIDEMKQQYGRWDTAWGEIHRVGRGGQYFPVGGAEFRSGNKDANFSETLFDVRCDPDPDQPGRYIAHNGSMAMILMFFHKDGIESLTCTPWGQSGHRESSHYLDQGEKLYSQRRLKPSWWNEKDLRQNLKSSQVLTITK